jgi:hypothetical protein
MTDGNDRAVEGLVHLQTAALEMIKAARAFLDVVEDMVQDPGTAKAVVTAMTSVAQTLAQAGRPAGEAHHDSGVERIVVT